MAKLKPIHPGEILREEFMVPLRLNPNKLALALPCPLRPFMTLSMKSGEFPRKWLCDSGASSEPRPISRSIFNQSLICGSCATKKKQP